MVGNKIIAVDLGGTHLRVGVVKNNKILQYIKKGTPKTKKELVNLLLRLIESLMTKEEMEILLDIAKLTGIKNVKWSGLTRKEEKD